MGQARDEAGNIWETDAAGNPVRLLQAAGGQPQGIMIKPASPAAQYEAPRAAADLAKAQNQAAASQYDPALAAAQARKAEADAARVAMEIEQERRKQSGEKTPKQMLQERFKLDNVLSTIREARQLVRKGGNTGAGSYLQYLPATEARSLARKIDTLTANLSFDRLQEMRDNSTTGGALGSITERELALLGSTVASLDQGMSAEEVLASLDRIERNYTRMSAAMSGLDPDSREGQSALKEIVPSAARAPADTGGNDGSPPLQVGIERRFSTEQDKRFGALADAAFQRGATRQELNNLAQQYGYPAYGPDLDAAIQYRDRGGKGARIAAPESGLNDPNILQRAIEPLAGSSTDAFLRGAANAATLGFLDEMQGGIQSGVTGGSYDEAVAQADLIKNLTARANPGASLAGTATGGLLAGLVTGGGASAMGALAPRAIAGDVALGAGFGAGESNQDRLGGALQGGLLAGAAGAAGRGVIGSLGGAIGGIRNPDAQLLRSRGVTMTPGQLGAASGSPLGARIAAREQRLAGLPGSDVPIAAAQRRGIEQFNRATFDEGLAPIGQRVPDIAERGVEQALGVNGQPGAVAAGYAPIANVALDANDQAFVSGMQGLVGRARQLPAIGDEAAYQLESSFAPFINDTGQITGGNFQNITQELARRGSALGNSPASTGPDAQALLREALGEFEGLANRQAPDAFPQLQAANRAYGNMKVVEDAVGRAANTEGVFSPAQLGMAARAAGKKFGGNQAKTTRPFFDLQRAGQNILPKKVPDSGTAGRMAEGSMLGKAAAAVRGPRVSAVLSEPVLAAINRLALDRPDLARQVGEEIVKRQRLGGLIGAGGSLQSFQF